MATKQQNGVGNEIKRGSGELAILAVLEQRALHGYEIAKSITRQSGGGLQFDVASLYPLLYRLEKRGWIRGEWEQGKNRPRRRYSITAAGRRKLAPLRSQWRAFFEALDRLAGVGNA